MPAPASVSTNTSWPWPVSSRTAPGTRPTRNSRSLISLGTPIRMGLSLLPLRYVERICTEPRKDLAFVAWNPRFRATDLHFRAWDRIMLRMRSRDAIDQHIVKLLQEDGRMSNAALAAA